MKKISVFFATTAITVVILFGISMIANSQTTASAPAQYKPSPAVKSKATSPMPGPTAKQQTKQATIGQEKVMVDTGHPDNSFWIEEIDLEGNGRATDAQMMWDDVDKVLFIYTEKDFKCYNGAPADGDFMIATYAAGNKMKRPAGSGWWMAQLNQGECGVKSEGLYGCKFNQNGVNTACGLVTLDDKTHDLTIIETVRTRQ